MLFRRVLQHVKEQNWTAIGIDLVIVVVGVFIGIQVSNWNEFRQEAEKTQTYIDRIRLDLNDNQKDFIERQAYFRQVQKHAIKALASLKKADKELDRQFLIDVYQASQYLPRSLGRDTYDEILSVGALNSEKDLAIRKRLSNFYRSLTALLKNIQTSVPYRDFIRGILDYDIQKSIRESCGDIFTTGENGEPVVALPEVCELDLTDTQLGENISAIRQAKIKTALTRRVSQLDITLRHIDLTLARIQLLDNYLKSAKNNGQ